MDINGARGDIAKKLQQALNAKRSPDGTAAGAAFIRDGELVAAFACGTRDGFPQNPATVDDLFCVGSISKLYCALAVMKLVEMGKVGLDIPVAEYLPRFKMKDERYRQITLRMLLNHSSGLPGTNLKYCFSTQWLDETLYDDFLDCFAKSKLKDQPGNASVYCNDGYLLAEMVVAEVSGMDYIGFVREHIACPAGAASTCSGSSNPESRVRIHEKGKQVEFIMNTGSGGIYTDLSDCARIGALLLDPKGILSPESVAEITRLQGKSFLPDVTPQFGLGLDFVAFAFDPYDFGEHTLAKGGGTASFGSFLIVSPQYRLAAAIALTNDNKIAGCPVLCELCALLLEEYVINARKEPSSRAATFEPQPLPEGFERRFSGTYYSCAQGFRAGFDGGALRIERRGPNGWADMIADARFDGRRFRSGGRAFGFAECENSCYLIEDTQLWGSSSIAQKCACLPPIHAAWQSRAGKKYIACDAHPSDILLGQGGLSLTVERREEEPGLLFFAYTGPVGPCALPVAAPTDRETEMVLNAPLHGSREGFAPFVFERDGAEYLYAFGYTLIDTAYLPPLETGRVVSDKPRQNRIFRTAAGSKIRINLPDDARLLLLDSNLKLIHDSASGQPLPDICDGFISFVAEAPMCIPVEVL